MPKFLPKNRRLRIVVILVAIAAFFGVGAAGAWWIARPLYKNWREERANQVARDFFQKGDYPNALLAVRKTLGYNQLNVDAWRLAVEITEKQGTPEVIFYQQHLANVQPTFENRLKHLQLAVKFHAYKEAEATISKIGEQGAKSPEFLELAALVSRRTGNATRAKYYLMSLVSLQPSNAKARFDLAQLRLVEGVTENKPSIRAEIRNLATDPEFRARGYGLLLADSLQSQNSSESLELADQLSQIPDIPPTTSILVLDAYRRFAPSRFKTLLTQMQERFKGEADKVIILTNYLIGNEMPGDTRSWIDALDEKVRTVEGVQVTYAYALLMLKDWEALETFLRGCKWVENEYARHALLAYRYRMANREREFNEEWRLAVIELGNNPRRLQTLLTQVTSWNWQDQRFELMWKRFTLEPGNASIRNQLIVWERGRGNTSGLNRLFARMVEYDPKDMDAKNNYAYTSMLLGINLDRAYQSAREAHEANPKNPFYSTTQAFSLYRQGKYENALDIMHSMGVAAITVPERTLLQAVILIANGKFEEGASMAMPLKLDSFLPEERRLLNDALASVERSRRDQGSAARLAALTATPGTDRKSFVALLPGALRENLNVHMELADSLYGSDDYKGLEAALKNERWENREFIRQGLLSYAQRQQSRDGDARSTWRVAVAAAGNNSTNLSTLADLAQRWGWTPEYIEILSKIFQRDPTDVKSFSELVEHYSRGNQTAELANLYRVRLEGSPNDGEAKARFAYYSLLTNSNASRAHVLAREAYEQAPENPLRAKVYVFSLYKQSRGNDAQEVLKKLDEQKSSGPLQLSLVRAALAAQQNQAREARAQLAAFDPSSALPEEAALADAIAKGLPPAES
jgi:cellulose synthase operon protein C